MARYEDILEALLDHLRPLAPDDVELDEDSDLVEKLGLDSTAVTDMVLEIEDRYDITIPLNHLTDVETAGELARLIHRIIEEG